MDLGQLLQAIYSVVDIFKVIENIVKNEGALETHSRFKRLLFLISHIVVPLALIFSPLAAGLPLHYLLPLVVNLIVLYLLAFTAAICEQLARHGISTRDKIPLEFLEQAISKAGEQLPLLRYLKFIDLEKRFLKKYPNFFQRHIYSFIAPFPVLLSLVLLILFNIPVMFIGDAFEQLPALLKQFPIFLLLFATTYMNFMLIAHILAYSTASYPKVRLALENGQELRGKLIRLSSFVYLLDEKEGDRRKFAVNRDKVAYIVYEEEL